MLFADRHDAGRQLAAVVERHVKENALFLAVPRGGVPVANALSSHFQRPLGLMVVRKLPIPHNPEMGFGAVGPTGAVAFNEEVMARAGIGKTQAEAIAREALREVKRRQAAYDCQPESLSGRQAWLVDDGLATGYTMLAAIRECRALDAAEIAVSIPVCHAGAKTLVETEAPVHSLHVAHGYSFAVASHYENFPDLTDDEVLEMLTQARNERRIVQDGD